MSEQENGGAAFPDFKQTGMTLRDYFAAKAMQSLILLPEYVNNWPSDIAARDAYQFADAMIAARKN